MNIEIRPVGDDRVKVIFRGRLDTPGVDRVETRFVAAVVPGGRHTLVDLSEVDFIGSLAVRMFISVARSLGLRQAKLFLISPQAQVRDVFDHVALSDIIPICVSEAEAHQALGA